MSAFKYLSLGFIIVCCFGHPLIAQLQMDSLTKQLEFLRGEDLVEVQLQVASRLVQINPSKADSLVRIAINTASTEGFKKKKAIGWIILSGLLSNNGKTDSAEALLNEALELCRSIDYNKGLTGAHLNYGALLIKKHEYEQAVYQHIQGLKIASKDTSLVSYELTHLMNLGIIKQTLEDYEDAKYYLLNALERTQRLALDYRKAQVLGNLGIVEFKQNNFGRSVEYHHQAYEIFARGNIKLAMANSLLNLGLANTKLENYGKALDYYDRSIALWQGIEDKRGEGLVLLHKAEVYLREQRPDLAFKVLKMSEEILLGFGDHQNLSKVYEQMSEADILNGDNKSALDHYKRSVTYQDSIRAKTKEADLNRVLARSEINRLEKEKELILQISDLKLQRTHQAIALVVGMLLLVVALYLWNGNRLKVKLRLQELTTKITQQEVALKTKEFETEKDRLQSYADRLLESYESLRDKKELLETQLTEDFLRKKEVDDLIVKLRDSISSENDWTTFRLYFDRAYPEFFEHLKRTINAELTFSEQRLVALMKINLSNKEIGVALNIQRDSVVRAKIRLKEKLGYNEVKEMEDLIQNQS